MKVDRRKFLACAVGSTAFSSCRYMVDVGRPALFVRITGLCGLVTKDARSGGMDVLMLDALKTGVGKPHQARLMTLPNNVISSTDTPKLEKLGDRMFSSWDLTGYDVSIAADNSGRFSSVKMARERNFNETLPKEDMFGDVSWIPRMERLTKNKSARVASTYFEANPGDKIAARVLFTHGELSSIFPVTPIDFPAIAFKFDPVPEAGAYQQALGDAQVFQLLPTGIATFTLTPFPLSSTGTNSKSAGAQSDSKGAGTQKTIKLRAGATGAGALEVILSNLLIDGKCSTTTDLQVLDHYKAYYELLDKSVPVQNPPPIPKYVKEISKPLDCAGHEDEFIRCGPMMF